MTERLRFDSKSTCTPVVALAATLLLTALSSVYFAENLAGGPPQKFDAYHTLLRSLNLLKTGDWLSLHYNFEPVFKKPPLQYMLTAALLGTGMDHVLALRVWPFVFTIGAVLLTGALAGLVARGSWWVIPSAAALLISSCELWETSRFGLLDSGQSFFLVLTFCCVLLAERNPRWWIPTGIAVGLGFLQKTPVALVAVAVWLLLQNLMNSKGSFGWARLRQNANFRSGCWIALALCAVWPAIQLARHGGEFFETFFISQMFDRFDPTAGLDTSLSRSPFKWLKWIFKDGPLLWPLALALIPAILSLSRFRKNFELRGIAWLVVLCALMLTLSRGKLYSRYLLVFLPFLAVTTSIALAELLPRRWMAPLLCLALLAGNVPNLAKVREKTRDRDMSEIVAVSRRFRERLGDGENPVFVRPGHVSFPPPAFVYYADLDRPILLIRFEQIGNFESWAAKWGMSPPYLGVSHVENLEGVRSGVGAIERVEELGSYVIWRLPKLGNPETPDREHRLPPAA